MMHSVRIPDPTRKESAIFSSSESVPLFGAMAEIKTYPTNIGNIIANNSLIYSIIF
jgi:hypothetical protein